MEACALFYADRGEMRMLKRMIAGREASMNRVDERLLSPHGPAARPEPEGRHMKPHNEQRRGSARIAAAGAHDPNSMIGELEMATGKIDLGHMTAHATVLGHGADSGRRRGAAMVAVLAF